MNAHDLETPSVLIDLDIMEANIKRMQTQCNVLGVQFRPHIKTHKLPDIARMQLEAGAVGIACQKTSEAQVFAEAGFTDIQIPYNIVGKQKTQRLMDMAKTARMATMADHPTVAQGLSEAAQAAGIVLPVLVDVATAANRTGASTEMAVALAKQIDADKNLHFAGLLVYPSYRDERAQTVEIMEQLKKDGLNIEAVSGGGTGAALEAIDFPELTELRVGTYVFYDWSCVIKRWTVIEHCAMTITATVVSTPTADRVILDAGRKSIASDRIADGHGHIVEYPDAHIYALSEEHGHVDVSQCERKPAIGDIVHIIPVHTCVVTNLHNEIYGVRNGQVEVTWPIAARGMVR